MRRPVATALVALASLVAVASSAHGTEVVWPTGGGDTAWTGLSTWPAVTPDGGLALVRRDSGGNDNLVRMNASGSIVSTGPNLATGWTRDGLSADSTGNVYMSEERSPVASRLVRISPEGTTTTVWQQSPVDRYIDGPSVIDGRGRLVFIAVDQTTATASSKIVRVNPDGTGAQEFQPDPPSETMELAVDQSGNAFVAIRGAAPAPARVMKISAEGALTQLAALPDLTPTAIAAGPDGILYVAYFDGSLSRVSPEGVVTSVPGVTLCGPTSQAAVSATGSLYLTAQCGGTEAWLYAISGNGTQETLRTFSGEYPYGTTLDGAGNLSAALLAPSGASRIVRLASGGGTPAIGPAPPAVPPAPTATAGDRSATVAASNPANAQFGTPTSYEVSAVQDPARACTITAPSTSCTVTGLAGGTSYTFVARARLLAWLTPASPASNAVTPTAPTPAPSPKPAALRTSIRCSGATCVTTGPLPAGATRVTQGATTGSGAMAMREPNARKSAKGRCTLSPAKVKGRKAKKRTYTCRIRLTKGTWTVTTTAFAGRAAVAAASRKVKVRR